MNQIFANQKPTAGNKPQAPKIQNFLESLKNNPMGGSPFGGGESPFGADSPFAAMNRQKELEKQRVAQFQQARMKEWEQVYSAKDKQVQKQIEDIRLQLKELAKQIVAYDQNVNAAIQMQVVKPGTYHMTFFEHIRNIIEMLRKNVAEANSWLSTFKKRGQQKGAFWKNSAKGGTAYMMANEHAISRSVG